MPKGQRQQIREKVVYKCNSRKCKGDGFHKEDDMEEIVLVLKVGKGCPLNFEEEIRTEPVRVVERAIQPQENTPEVIPSDGVMTPRMHAPHMSGGAQPVRMMPDQNPAQPNMGGGPGRKSPVPMELLRRGLQMNPPPDQRLVP